jgi:hypothetical protein
MIILALCFGGLTLMGLARTHAQLWIGAGLAVAGTFMGVVELATRALSWR